ncbi:high mobility group B protein 9 isoform X2 [Malania oleifera]|uniref:high mobility group B protein 9 isoform X2 n=1 Tax=Malania oleifera TaxID=397392 RepID=UPI0025AE2542|nr:high mobility group B protein 9 isoform X2 [Malania oleifera]
MSSPAKLVIWKGGENKRYPAPLASHDDVVEHPSLFWDTLRRFHSMLGTKFMIPVIGGKELDLHVLYVEVTKRGGFDKVVVEKKWREVGSVFNFSPTTTSASFVLRKHYHALLHHYEHVYFFKIQGPLLTQTAAYGPEAADLAECSSKKTGDCPNSPGDGSAGLSAVGTIDGKFDCGYLVCVKLGSEVLNGVLYHPEQPVSSASAVQACSAIVPYPPKARRTARRSRRRGGDPDRPKPNRSGYNFFFAEKHSVLKAQFPDREREFTKMIGQSWNNLSQEERMVYQDIGMKDKERYKKELEEYKERIKLRVAPKEEQNDH